MDRCTLPKPQPNRVPKAWLPRTMRLASAAARRKATTKFLSAAGKRVGDNIARSGRRSVAALNDAGGGCRRRAERPSPLRRA